MAKKPVLSGIYLIVNKQNWKSYVGQASDVKNRWSSHKKDLKFGIHGNRHLQRAWDKYGESVFEFFVIDVCEKDKAILCKREQLWIDLLDPEYNIARVAESTLGVKYTEESKARMSAMRRGVPKANPFSEEHKANLRSSCGTPENRERLRSLHLGKRKSEAQRAKMSAWQVGKPKSEETRKRISEALKARHANAG